MQNTPPVGSTAEPALIYEAGERRSHAEHAAEAYDAAGRADALADMVADTLPGTVSAAKMARLEATAARTAVRAQWHATMAVYEALRISTIT